MRALIACVVLLGGCDRVFGLAWDASIYDAPTCFGKSGEQGAGLLRVCFTDVVADELTLPASISTDDPPSPACTQIVHQDDLLRTEVCVIAAHHLSVVNGVVLRGKRPVVLIGFEALTVSSYLDASTHRGAGNMLGPAANDASCVTTANDGNDSNTGGSGAAGGSFQTLGGTGGMGSTSGTSQAGGVAAAAQPLSYIRGGCRGGKGGSGTGSVAPGPFGSSGGALYLISGDRLEITGAINASGGGGGGGTKSNVNGGSGAGGGGGGSGGLIGLDAPHIVLAATAQLVANGGGGGGGGGGMGAGNTGGQDGREPVVSGGTFPYVGAGGALGLPGGNDGGDGGVYMLAPGKGKNASGGGGGGGGSVGYIAIYTTDLADAGALLSPQRVP